jgi:hypothetical protein
MEAAQHIPEKGAEFSHIFARLFELSNYTWNPEIPPFHSVRRIDPGGQQASG